MITDITKAIYLEADVDGCWYPRVSAGQRVEEGDILGEIKDFFGSQPITKAWLFGIIFCTFLLIITA